MPRRSDHPALRGGMSEMALGLCVAAVSLRWQQHTAFVAGGGMDGDLVATLADGRTHVLPLDVYTSDELASDTVKPPFGDGFGIATARQVRTIDDIHQAVRTWCAAQLGCDDVDFGDPR